MGASSVEALLEEGLAARLADEVELIAVRNREELTRFTWGGIHQNVATSDTTIYARAWVDGKQGVAETNDPSPEGIERVIRRAAALASAQGKPAGYSPPDPQPVQEVTSFDQETWEATPDRRAELVARAVREAKELGLNASGSLSTGGTEIWVVTSRGVEAHHRGSETKFVTVVTGKKAGSGYAEFSSWKLADFAPEEVAARAVRKALDSEERIAIEPGEYQVVLEEPAVATLVGMMAFMGFSARALLEGRSFLADKLGQKLVSDMVTLYDDGLDPRGLPLPFDFEGVPKRRVYFFRAGVAEGVVHDSRTAALMGTQSTGHALPPPYAAYSPLPLHLVMEPGTASRQELIAGVKRGLLVTRFHYARTVDPRSATVTMMTRDGTFLIEDGELRGAVEDLRVTESCLRALNELEAVGAELSLITGSEAFGSTLVPPLRIGKFTFTGRTERM